jgi:hypothetical protein
MSYRVATCLNSVLLITALSSHSVAAESGSDVQSLSIEPAAALDDNALDEQRAKGQAELPPRDEIILTDTNNILTPRRRFVVEPSFSYTNSSSTQVAIEGFTVIPAIVIGLINVSQVQRDTFTAAMNLRYGITDRLEFGLKLPYVYREVSVRQREALKGTPVDSITSTSGSGLGDIEASINYQFRPSLSSPSYWVTNLQIKSDTGTDPFELQWLATDPENSGEGLGEVPPGEDGITGKVLAEQPTGSGFWSVQPGVSYIFQADPVVLYGSLGYLWNEERDIEAFGGVVDPGNAISVGFGMGVAFNSDMSFSLGYSHSTVQKTRFENQNLGLEPSFSRFQVGSLRLGFSRRLTPDMNFKLSLGIGLTDAAPDVQLGFSIPYTP